MPLPAYELNATMECTDNFQFSRKGEDEFCFLLLFSIIFVCVWWMELTTAGDRSAIIILDVNDCRWLEAHRKMSVDFIFVENTLNYLKPGWM